MSDEPVVTGDSGSAAAGKGFLARAVGVFVSPGDTFADVARRPTVVAPLLLLWIGFALISYVIAPAQGRDSAAFTEGSSFFQRLPEDQREAILEQQRNPSPVRRAVSAALGPGAVVGFMLLFALIYWGIGHLLGGEPTFKGMLSVLLFSSMISVLANYLVKLPFILSQGTVFGVTFGPAMLMPELEVTSFTYRALYFLDLFSIWGTAASGIGFARVARLSTSTGMIVAFALFLVGSGIGLGLGSLFL